MTALCGGGASRARPGIPTVVTLTGGGLAYLAGRLGFTKLREVLGFAVSGTTFSSALYCANDPPPDPNLTEQDILDALDVGNPVTSVPAIARVVQWVLHTYWWDICECESVVTPPPPAPSNPGGSTSDPGLGRTSPSPCFTWEGSMRLPASLGSGQLQDYTAFVFPPVGVPVTRTAPGQIPTVQAQPIPPGLKSTTTTVTLDAGDGISSGAFVVIGYWDAAGTSLRQDTIGQGSTHTPIRLPNFATPAGAATWAIYTNQAASAGVESGFAVQLAADCGGPGFTSDCCPPDPSLDLRLRQIIELIMNLQNPAITDPGYQLGPVHAGITGTASIGIPSVPGGKGLRGMKVEVTAGIPSHLVLPGNPPYQWDLGWMSFLTGDGMIQERRLTRQNQVWLDPNFPLATTFGYYLNPGVVATFTELEPKV